MLMDKEDNQIEPAKSSEDTPTSTHKKALLKKWPILRILIWIVLILVIDIFLTIALIISERRLSGDVHKYLSLPAILTLILSLKVAIIILSGRIIMFLLGRSR